MIVTRTVPLAMIAAVAFVLMPSATQQRITTLSAGTESRAAYAIKYRQKYADGRVADHPCATPGRGSASATTSRATRTTSHKHNRSPSGAAASGGRGRVRPRRGVRGADRRIGHRALPDETCRTRAGGRRDPRGNVRSRTRRRLLGSRDPRSQLAPRRHGLRAATRRAATNGRQRDSPPVHTWSSPTTPPTSSSAALQHLATSPRSRWSTTRARRRCIPWRSRHGAAYLDPGRNLGFGAGANLALRKIIAGPPRDVLLLNPDAVLAARDARDTRPTISIDPGTNASRPCLLASIGSDGSDQRVEWPFPTPAARLGGGGRAWSSLPRRRSVSSSVRCCCCDGRRSSRSASSTNGSSYTQRRPTGSGAPSRVAGHRPCAAA